MISKQSTYQFFPKLGPRGGVIKSQFFPKFKIVYIILGGGVKKIMDFFHNLGHFFLMAPLSYHTKSQPPTTPGTGLKCLWKVVIEDGGGGGGGAGGGWWCLKLILVFRFWPSLKLWLWPYPKLDNILGLSLIIMCAIVSECPQHQQADTIQHVLPKCGWF